jgi:hypothetical protein
MAADNPQNRDNAGRFLPGVSGNPSGRPKSLSRYIREKTNDGADIADFMLNIFTKQEKIEYEKSDGSLVSRDPNLREQMEAANWLSDRGFGKPTQPISGDEDKPPVQIDILDPVQRRKLLNEYITSGQSPVD